MFAGKEETEQEEKEKPFKFITFEFFPPDEFAQVKSIVTEIVKQVQEKNLIPPSSPFILEVREFEREMKDTFKQEVFMQPSFSEIYTLLLAHYFTTRKMFVNEIERSNNNNSSNTVTKSSVIPPHTNTELNKTIILDDGLATKLFLFSSFEQVDEYELYQNIEFAFLGIYPELSFFKDPESIFKNNHTDVNENKDSNIQPPEIVDYKKIKDKIEKYIKLYEVEGKTKCIMLSDNISSPATKELIMSEIIKVIVKKNSVNT